MLLLNKRFLLQALSGTGVFMGKAVKTGTSGFCSIRLGRSISNDIENTLSLV